MDLPAVKLGLRAIQPACGIMFDRLSGCFLNPVPNHVSRCVWMSSE